MATTRKNASSNRNASSKAPAGKSTTKASPDAIALLRADHRAAADLFAQFEKARSAKRKAELAAQICEELAVHAQIEEEIFYPAFVAATKDKSLVPEASVEHQSMKDLIAQVESQTPDDPLFGARVKVLGEYVKHHVKEEQTEMFAKARKSKLDLKQIGEQLQLRKQELKATRT